MLNKKLLGTSSGLPQDDNFENVTLLLNGDGTNGGQNNTFVDSSTNNFTITRNGNTTQGSFSPYGTLWSNYFNGSTDWFTTASSSAFAFGTGAFTMEAWIFPTASQTDNWIIGLANNCWLRIGSSGKLEFYDAVANSGTLSANAVSLNTWSHVAAVRSGTTLTLYINGSSAATATVSSNFSTNVACTIGNQSGQSRYWNGYISNARVVKGTAVYTSTFTPSLTPLTAITNTSILTCQSNRFIDNSSNAFALTINGSPSVQRFSPFEPSAPYSTSVIGGSGYFDGSEDYLTVPSNSALDFGTGDFTVEFWVYPTSLTFNIFLSAPQNVSTQIAYDNGGRNLYFYRDANIISGTAANSLIVNQWNHVVVSRSGTTLSLFSNGVRRGTTTYSSAISFSAVHIGQYDAGSYFTVGYLTNVRLVKGTAVYDPTQTTYTIPTAPLTAITNTSLLCNFTNASIADLAMQNNLETVGNAQVSTSVKKFGTGSLAFDGTGDEIQITRANQAFDIAGSTHCVELWIYPTSWATGEEGDCFLCFGTNTSTNSGQFRQKFGDRLQYYIGSTINMETSVIPSINTWSHIVATYDASASRARIFIDGVLRATQSTSSSAIGSPLVLTLGVELNSLKRNYFNGYMDDVRITRGVIPSLYQTTSTTLGTTVFTPPSAPLPIY